MNISENDKELITSYLFNELPLNEADNLLKRIQMSSELQEEYETQKKLKDGLTYLSFKNILGNIHSELESEGNLFVPIIDVDSEDISPKIISLIKTDKPPQPLIIKSFKKINYLMIAASIILFIGVFSIWRVSQKDPYEQYYKNDSNFLRDFKLSNPQNETIFKEAYSAYNANDFKRSINIINKISSASTEEIAFKEYTLGLNYLANSEYNQAIKHFEEIDIKNINPRLIERIDWYEAITYLRLKNKPMAVNKLNRVVEKDSEFKKSAMDLLKKLEE